MSHISKPVDWEVFSIPPIQPVQYYSILKKKREFSQLIKQYDAQVFKQGYLHYCSIVPKNISSSLNNRYEIFIVFFDETPNTSFIGFRVKVSKETFMHECNSLLLFLKKSKKAISYLMNNNFIHVQCETNAWELFYLLYDHYLRKCVLTIIGTRFFYLFVYSSCIQREMQLLKMLYKGSKVIRVSKRSIYYKIHGKRKISVTDLIHMTLNMPKSKRYIISCFSSQESILYSDVNKGDFYTPVGSKIKISKLVLKKYKKETILVEDKVKDPIIFKEKNPLSDSIFYSHSESLELPECKPYKSEELVQKVTFINATFKRKFHELENYKHIEPGPSTSKCLKTSEICLAKNQWEQYQNLKPYTIKSYSNIPFVNPLVNNLLKNGNLSYFHSNPHLLKTHSNSDFALSSIASDKAKYKISGTPGIQETPELTNKSFYRISKPLNIMKDNLKTTDTTAANESKSSFELENCFDCVKPSVFSLNLPNIHSDSHEKHHFSPDRVDLQKNSDTKTSVFLPRTDNYTNQDYFNDSVDDVCFTTGAGKAINVSTTAMLKAHQLIKNDFNEESKEILQGTGTCSQKKNKMYSKTPNFEVNYPGLKRKAVTKGINLPKSKFSDCIDSINCEVTPNKCETILSTNMNENLRSDNFDVDFSTAAGKKINVSNSSMEVAQKLIQGAFQEDKKPAYSRSTHSSGNKQRNKTYKNINEFKNIGGPSEAVDVDMDKTLVEKFFEETLFDEKELELTGDCNKNDDTDVALKSNSQKNLPIRKPRKSLGGRRSMKYCSDKL